jgi:hypothetical protein
MGGNVHLEFFFGHAPDQELNDAKDWGHTGVPRAAQHAGRSGGTTGIPN